MSAAFSDGGRGARHSGRREPPSPQRHVRPRERPLPPSGLQFDVFGLLLGEQRSLLSGQPDRFRFTGYLALGGLYLARSLDFRLRGTSRDNGGIVGSRPSAERSSKAFLAFADEARRSLKSSFL